jgi:membrane protein DedA with SNARE-associated domain
MGMDYFFSIFLGTFVLEDLALATAVSWSASGLLSLPLAFWAAFLGISIGDIGIYGLGNLCSRFGWESRVPLLKRLAAQVREHKHDTALSYSIVLSRIIPGTRLPTYFAAGYLHYSISLFTILTLLSVGGWVLSAILIGKSIHVIVSDHLLLSIVAFLLVIQAIKAYVPQLVDPWKRRALMQSYRRWLHFEFWPAWFFYIPVVFQYLHLSLRYKSALIPFYINPNLKNGGLIGESKWDFLKHLDPKDPSTLKSLKIQGGLSPSAIRELIEAEGFDYPFVLKPDVGQRGYAVRIIRSAAELDDYVLHNRSDVIAQRLSQWRREAGVFYVRLPNEEKGRLFSITDKSFPFVVGDGVHRLGDLILKDRRARIIAATYFERLRDRLDSIPLPMEKVWLSECGNHCQGAIFIDGNSLITTSLADEIDRLAKLVPDFYFGRFDIRYKDVESLREGRGFEIMEINGAGAEATHIWDAKTRLVDAYRTLFEQWRLAFEIGHQLKDRLDKSSQARIRILPFLLECIRVYWRKDKLSVSS